MADQGPEFQKVDPQMPIAQPVQPGMYQSAGQYQELQQTYPPPQHPIPPSYPGPQANAPLPPPGPQAMYPPPPVYALPQQPQMPQFVPQECQPPPWQIPQPGQPHLYPTQPINPQQPPPQFMVAYPATAADMQDLPPSQPPQGMQAQPTPEVPTGTQTNVIPSDAVEWTIWPTQWICRNCGKSIKTTNKKVVGTITWIACVLMAPCGLCFCPFLMDSCRDTEQRCPECNELLKLVPAY